MTRANGAMVSSEPTPGLEADPWDVLLNAPVTFGLSAKLRAIVAEQRANGAGWATIGQEIGWEPDTLQRHFERSP